MAGKNDLTKGLIEDPVFRYKRNKTNQQSTLPADARHFGMVRTMAARGCSKVEMAAILQCSRQALGRWLAANPEAQEAFDEGRELGRYQLRQILWKQAEQSPQAAQFLAKQKEWLDYSDGRQDTNINVSLTVEEKIKQIEELQGKMLPAADVIDVEPEKE